MKVFPVGPVLALFLAGIALFTPCLQAASIVKVVYSLDGEPLARMTYTGGDRWEPEKFWRLLGEQPEFAYEVRIKPNPDNELKASLEGAIQISIEIRNQIQLGILEFENLELQRKDASSDMWFLSKGELGRLLKVLHEAKAGA